jgi:arabinogalactan oligomer/maltooligosaccharide transport system permease protein
MVVAGVTAILTVFLGALGAYAFSRFRFRGRRVGMLTLLLVQMFPLFLAFVAIYLIMLRVSDVFPHIGLNTRSGLILVYLGGVLGVNAWLMKGFFDSIPTELDESARVDGATATQIFWIVILPLGAPVLAVIGLLSFIATLNEYVLASILLQSPDKFTLSVGLFTFVSREYGQQWGPFCAGVVLMAVPVVILFLFLQRFIVHGLTGGVKG